jgi:adenylosuccinate lyase
MVPRYARPQMTALWEPEAKYRIWFEIEAHATEKLGELGVVPPSAAKALWDWWATNPTIDVDAIDAIEAVTKHDVIAFLTWVAEQVGDEARFMHQGMTSSDVLDTTLSVQLARATDILIDDMDGLLAAIKTRAMEHKYTPTIGRSHGIHAEPMPSSAVAATGWLRRGPRLRPAQSAVRSAPLPMSIRRSKPTWPTNSASPSSPSARR